MLESYLKTAEGKSVLMDWLTTVDHKKIGVMYIFAAGFFFLLAGIEAILIRIQLIVPNNDFLSASTYNEMITMHGTTMMFFAALPILFGLMNFIVPLQIGARDVAFPFLNALGFWLFFFGGVLLNISWFFGALPDAGWTAYSSLALDSAGVGVDYYLLSVQISGFGTIIGAINFLVTIVNMRAPGMSYMRMPLFTWSTFVTSALILYAFTTLALALFLLTFDRIFGAKFFDPAGGGNSIIYEHLFWIFGHPEVYILLLPSLGIISEVISTFSKKRIFGYSSMVFATFLIGFIGFMVWSHHMFTTGLGPIANTIFGITTMAIAIPTGIKIFNYLFTMWGGSIKFTTAMLFAVGFIPSFVMGGVTGVMLGVPAADYQFHDTYFVVAHFHYVIIASVVFGIFSGIFYWYPKIFGKKLDEKLGIWQFWLFFSGFHLTFFPQHFLGLFGMPRRIFTYLPGQGFETLNMISTIGAIAMFGGSLLLIVNIVKTARAKAVMENDPWDGRTLEWAISSPPPEYNFVQVPLVKSLDAFFTQKYGGKDEGFVDAEPAGMIHMPNPSILPLFIAFGLFIAGLAIIYHQFVIAAIGILITFLSMLTRSVKDDHGYHIEVKQKDATPQIDRT